MYTIRYIRDGHYVTDVGGPLRTLDSAIRQMNALSNGIETTELDSIVGCKWTMATGVTCALIVVNYIGQPIKLAE
jgi:hypothetical protein